MKLRLSFLTLILAVFTISFTAQELNCTVKVIAPQIANVEANEGYSLAVDLASQKITLTDGSTIDFEVDGFRKHCLLNGLDDIALTLESSDDISAFEEKHKKVTPWLFA